MMPCFENLIGASTSSRKGRGWLYTVFDLISSNINEVLLINPSANLFVFGDFNIHHKAG